MPRPKGEGNISERSDGRWMVRITVHDENGQAKKVVRYAKTEEAAKKALRQLLAQHERGELTTGGTQLLSKFLDSWLEDSARPTIRQSTYSSYRTLVDQHLNPGLGHHKLEKLTPMHVQTFMNTKVKEGLSTRTVQYLHAILRRALGQALRWGMVTRNVAALVSPPRLVQAPMKVFTPEEAQRFLQVVSGHQHEALYTLALMLGLRRGEVLGLHWSDVDLERGTLTVRTSLVQINSKLQLSEPKTERSKRTLPLPPGLVQTLIAHRDRQQFEQKAAKEQWEDHNLIFCTRNGKPIFPRNIIREFDALLEKHKLPDLRFHDLRHTCATLLLAQGVHPRVAMETLGHSRISETMDRYTHVLPTLQQDAVGNLERLLNGGK